MTKHQLIEKLSMILVSKMTEREKNEFILSILDDKLWCLSENELVDKAEACGVDVSSYDHRWW